MTPAQINALPEPIRRYIYDLETITDPAGMVREIAELRDMVKALTAELMRRTQDSERAGADREPESKGGATQQRFSLYIDGRKYESVKAKMDGNGIMAMAGRDASHQLFMEGAGDTADTLIGCDALVDLTREPRFYTVPSTFFGAAYVIQTKAEAQ